MMRQGRCGVYLWAIVVLPFITSCATTPRSRLHPAGAPGGFLTLAQLTVRVSRDAILRDDETYRILLASGIDRAQVRDGSLALGRVNCCGGPLEAQTALAFYMPDDVLAEVWDIVEVRLGRAPEKPGDVGVANRAIRVVQQGLPTTGHLCRWEPPDPHLWGRVLYCDWMREQGWVAEGPAGSIYRAWIKRP